MNSALMRPSLGPKVSTALGKDPARLDGWSWTRDRSRAKTAPTALDGTICVDSMLIFKACDAFAPKVLWIVFSKMPKMPSSGPWFDVAGGISNRHSSEPEQLMRQFPLTSLPVHTADGDIGVERRWGIERLREANRKT